jgi:hypothetical protein
MRAELVAAAAIRHAVPPYRRGFSVNAAEYLRMKYLPLFERLELGGSRLLSIDSNLCNYLPPRLEARPLSRENNSTAPFDFKAARIHEPEEFWRILRAASLP